MEEVLLLSHLQMRKVKHRVVTQGHVVGWFGDQNSNLLDVHRPE